MRAPPGFIILLFTSLVITEAVPAGAKETFKDEAGRVIYTIDDEGIVSMFENSANDITLSVTRGAREQMQPSIAEVTPASVPPGSNITLKIKGKNLVGAKVALSIPQIEVGTPFSRPQTLEVPIHVPPTVPPGDVAIVVMTPIGRTQAAFSVTQPQQSKLPGSPDARKDQSENSKDAVSTAAPASCPDGMVGVAAERGGFCIEIDQTFSGDLRKAEKTCAIGGKRLCAAAEWREACEQSQKGQITLKNIIGDWEWTSSVGRGFGLTSVLLGEADCSAERLYQPWKSEAIPGRCCR